MKARRFRHKALSNKKSEIKKAEKLPRPLHKRALRLYQNRSNPIYMFTLSGEELLNISDISRISRDDAGKLLGYQRPEVKQHIDDIVAYLNSDDVVFPNALILALSSDPTFKESRGPKTDDGDTKAGTLTIPIPNPGEQKPAWLVDGQQRALAISKSKKTALQVPITAFVARNVTLQRDQFLRINNAKPLPQALLTELLPEISTPLPQKMAARKIPSELCNLLREDKRSPFFGLIYRASTPKDAKKKAVIKDTSIINALQESIKNASGCLFPYRNLGTGETDLDIIFLILITYWSAVKNTFPEAWGLPPDKSKLMGGSGIRAMGRLMDKIMSSYLPDPKNLEKSIKEIEKELAIIKPVCAWTKGKWEEVDGGTNWKSLQVTPRHTRELSSFLIRTYVLRDNRKR